MILLFSLHSSLKRYLSNYKHESLVLKIAQPGGGGGGGLSDKCTYMYAHLYILL